MPPQFKVLIGESGSGYGGTAKYLSLLLPYFRDSNFEIEVAADRLGPFIQEIKSQGGTVHHVPGWRFPWTPLETKQWTGILGRASYLVCSFFQFLVMVPWIALWLLGHKIQIVHLNNEISSHFILIHAAKLAACKVVVHFHGWRSLTNLEKWAAQFADEYVSVTRAGAEFYSKELRGHKVRGIVNGLIADHDIADNKERRYQFRKSLGLGGNSFLITLIGRLIPLKGHTVFIEAFSLALKSNPELMGLIVGTDDAPGQTYKAMLVEQIKKMGLEAQIQFQDWQNDLNTVYSGSDLIIQPSVRPESFGLVLLEAMSHGKPVIATRLGGFQDVVQDGVTGLLVEPNHPSQLADAILKIAGDKVLARNMGEIGQKRALEEFRMEENAKQILSLYQNLMNHRGENGW